MAAAVATPVTATPAVSAAMQATINALLAEVKKVADAKAAADKVAAEAAAKAAAAAAAAKAVELAKRRAARDAQVTQLTVDGNALRSLTVAVNTIRSFAPDLAKKFDAAVAAVEQQIKDLQNQVISGLSGLSGTVAASDVVSVKPSFDVANLITTIGQTYQGYLAAKAQNKITNLNLKRLEAGLDPVDPGQVAQVIPAPRAQIEVGAETRAAAAQLIKPIAIGAGVLGALYLVSRAFPSRNKGN